MTAEVLSMAQAGRPGPAMVATRPPSRWWLASPRGPRRSSPPVRLISQSIPGETSDVRDNGDDEQLLAALRESMGARQAVPSWFVETGKNAYAWHIARTCHGHADSPATDQCRSPQSGWSMY
jgi:hypothetical protein